MYIDKKRVLLIAPKFYHYHNEIIKSLEDKGVIVTFYPEMKYGLRYQIIDKLSSKMLKKLHLEYMETILKKIKNDSYDIVFVIRGVALSPLALEFLHKKLPKASFFMYQWDSMKQNNYESIIPYFDTVQTFDMKDAKQYNLGYLPLFYTNHYKNLEKKPLKYDLVFFGAYHSDRLEVIKYVDKKFKQKKLIFKSHLYITKLALLRFLLQGVISFKDIKYFKTYSISLDEIIENYRHSGAVLDIELSIQNGLTIRTFETLGAGLKLVTTNENIKKEAFYDDSNIFILNRKELDLELDFFKKLDTDKKNFEQFHVDSWLDNILTINNKGNFISA